MKQISCIQEWTHADLLCRVKVFRFILLVVILIFLRKRNEIDQNLNYIYALQYANTIKKW